MVVEDFNTYTEVDNGGDLTVTAPKVAWASMIRNIVDYVYKDYGVGYFGDFEIQFTLNFSDIEAGDVTSTGICSVCSLANTFGSVVDTVAGDVLFCAFLQNAGTDDQFKFRLWQYTGGANDFSAVGMTHNTGTYYVTLTRFGTTINLKVYDNPARQPGDLLETLTDGGNGDGTAYRYVHAVQSWESLQDPNDHSTGYMEDLDLGLTEELPAGFEVRRSDSENLPSGFEILGTVQSGDLPALTCVHTVRVAQDLDAAEWVEYDAGALLGHDCNDSWWDDVRRDTQNTALMKTVTGGLGSDFFHEFTLNMFAVQQAVPGVFERICPWAAHLEMTSQDYYAQDDLKIAALVVLAILDEPDKYQLRLIEKGGDSDTMLTHWVNFQDRYIVIYKEGTRLIALAYQDAAHTILEDRAEITLSGDLDFLYVSMPMSWGVAGAGTSSGLVDPIFGSMENLPCGFSVRRTGTPAELLGTFDSGQGSVELLGMFDAQRAGSADLSTEFIVRPTASQDLPALFRVRCSRRFGGNWQRKMWHVGAYYWRGRYCPTDDRLEFEYIAEDGLAGNAWTENVNARIDASGFTGIDADFTVRGARAGISTTIHYSDGVDTWIAESDEASATGWAWQNLTKVFDGTPNDWYRRVNLAANRTTPTPRLWAVAVFYDDLPDGKQWVKASRQSVGGDITGWDAAVDVSNVANTSKIYGCSARSMGDAGPVKNNVIFVYKEGIAVRSRYYDGDWDDPIEDVDTTTLAGRAAWDLENVEMLNGDDMAHFIYVDADGSIQWRERDPGPAQAWSAASQLEAAHTDHFGVGIIDHGNGWSWCVWVHEDVLEYRLHICLPEVWYPLLANLALIFDPTTDAVITTSTIEQPQTPDSIHAGDAVPISWVGQTAPGAPCGLGWGILQGAAEEDLPAGFIVRQAGSQDLAAGFNAAALNENLGAELVVRQPSSANLLCGFIVRQPDSAELGASFDGQVSLNIPAEFSVRRSWLEELPAEFVAAQGSQSLAAEFIVRPTGSANLLGTINVIHFLALAAEFEIRSSSSENLTAELIVRHPGSEDLAAAFSVFAGTSTDLLGGFISRQSEAPVEGVLIAYDPRPFFNIEIGVGTGFTGGIKEGSDKTRKAAGEASMKVATRYEPKRHDYIRFGWRYRYPEIAEQSRDLGASFVVNQLDFEAWTDPAFSGAWYQAIAESFAQINAQPDHLEVATFNPKNSEDIIGGLWCYIGTMKKYQGCDISFDVQFQDPYPSGVSGGSMPTAGLTADRVPSLGGPNQIMVYYNVAAGEWHLNVGNSIGNTDVDLTGDVADFEARHLYRIIWETPSQYPATGRVRLYIDGVLKQTVTTNIPNLLLGFSCGATINLVGALMRPAAKLYTFDDGT